MNIRQRGAEAVALFALVLTGCQSAPTRTYTLFPVSPASSRQDYSGASVRIDAVHLPPAWNRLELMTSTAPGELRLDDLAHWSAPLSQLARQTLSEDLLGRLPADRVIFPRLPKPPGSTGITVDVLELQVGPSGATLQASWRIDAGGAPPNAPVGGTAFLKTGTPAAGAPAIASALSALFAQLADRIAASL